MAKKTNNKSKKVRSFKVHADGNGKPFVRFGGKYLVDELGISCGDRLEMAREGHLIMLRKLSAVELAQYEQHQQEKQQKAWLKKLFPRHQKQVTTLSVTENRSTL